MKETPGATLGLGGKVLQNIFFYKVEEKTEKSRQCGNLDYLIYRKEFESLTIRFINLN